MMDEYGHQLPNLQYPRLSRKGIVDAVEEFYDRYYFRPRVIFRILRRAMFDARECRRLFTEAKEFFELRAKRKRFVDPQAASRLAPS
jgi:hypothetical protein